MKDYNNINETDNHIGDGCRGSKKETNCESSPRYKESKVRASSGLSALENNFVRNFAHLIVKDHRDYTDLKLYSGKGEEPNPDVTWYFHCRLKNPDTEEMERIRLTFNINRVHDIASRMQLARTIIKWFNRALKDDEVDFFKVKAMKVQREKAKQVDSLPTDDSPLIIQLLNNALDAHISRHLRKNRKGEKKKEPNKRTRQTYELYVRRFGRYIQHRNLSKLRPALFTEEKANDFVDYLIEEVELANKTINETVGVIRMLFDGLRKQKLTRSNPFVDVEGLTVDGSSKYSLFSNDEKIAIAERLKETPLLNLAAQLTYGCFIRPQELCCLRRKDFDFTTAKARPATVTINYSIGKTTRTSVREIPENVLKLLKKMGVDKMHGEQLIFEPLVGNHPHPDLRRKKLSEAWKKAIIDEPSKGGLGIKKLFYWLKHQGNVDYVLNNEHYDILWLQQQNGHTSLDMTMKYLRDLPIRKLRASNAIMLPFGQLAA